MFVMRTVARRSSGMGLKVMKFHAILHLIDDMLLCAMMLFTTSNYYLPKIYSEITPIEGINLGIDFTTVKLQASLAI